MRITRNLGEDRLIGIEYYGISAGLEISCHCEEQSHQLFAVADFKVEKFDVELGLGYGLTPGSHGLIAKAIISYAFHAFWPKQR
jgi:hypothetical protein